MGQNKDSFFAGLLALSLCVFVLLVPFFKAGSKLIAYLIVVLFALTSVFSRRSPRQILHSTPLSLNFLFFIVASAAATIFSVVPFQSIEIVFQRYLLFFAFFLACYAASSPRSVRPFAYCLLGTGIFLGIGGMWDFFRNTDSRLFTIFGNEVYLTGFLPFYFSFAFALIIHERDWRLRLLALGCFACVYPVVIVHGSRIIWLTFIASLVFICLFKKRTLKHLAVIFVLCALGFSLMPQFEKHRALGLTNMFSRTALSDRVDLINSAISIFKSHAITGAGPGSFEFLYKPPVGHENDREYLHSHAHNIYAEVAAESGIIGLAAFLAIFAAFFFRFFRSRPAPADKALSLAFTASVFAVLFASCGNSFILIGTQEALLFWFFLANSLRLNNAITEGQGESAR